MKDVTVGLPAVAVGSGSAFPAPQVRQLRPNYCPPPCQPGAPCQWELRHRAVLVELLRPPAPEDEARAAAALAELDRALAEHGAPDPERTAAWLAAGAPVRP